MSLAWLVPGCLVDIPDVTLEGAGATGFGGAGGPTPGDGGGSGASSMGNLGGAGGVVEGSGGVGVTGGENGNGDGDTGGSSTGGMPDEPIDYPDNLIDDFEDGDIFIVGEQGRSGSWTAAVEPGATLSQTGDVLPEELASPRGDSQWALHLSGSDFAGAGAGDEFWGASLGTALNQQPLSDAQVYDVSGYTGVRFSVRGSGPFVMQLRTRQTLPVSDGGNGSCEPQCYDHFHASFPVTSTWETVEVPFSSLGQYGFGAPANLRLDNVITLNFQTNGVAMSGFDLYLDDIELY